MPSFQVVQSYTLVPPNAEDAQPGSPSTLACQMPPVPLQAGSSDRLHAVAVSTPPGAHNRRSNARVHQMLQATICVVKILRIHLIKFDGFVRKPALIRETRFEKPFVGSPSQKNGVPAACSAASGANSKAAKMKDLSLVMGVLFIGPGLRREAVPRGRCRRDCDHRCWPGKPCPWRVIYR